MVSGVESGEAGGAGAGAGQSTKLAGEVQTRHGGQDQAWDQDDRSTNIRSRGQSRSQSRS